MLWNVTISEPELKRYKMGQPKRRVSELRPDCGSSYRTWFKSHAATLKFVNAIQVVSANGDRSTADREFD